VKINRSKTLSLTGKQN